MKDTLADLLADPEDVELISIEVLFKLLLDNATPANARKIALHPLCPPHLAAAYRRRA